jgi:hypothetical protein
MNFQTLDISLKKKVVITQENDDKVKAPPKRVVLQKGILIDKMVISKKMNQRKSYVITLGDQYWN